jgi:hypothetical protein
MLVALSKQQKKKKLTKQHHWIDGRNQQLILDTAVSDNNG